jgi:hypothetical protein
VRERRWTGAAEEQQYVEGAMPPDEAPRPGEEELAEATATEEEAAAEDAATQGEEPTGEPAEEPGEQPAG